MASFIVECKNKEALQKNPNTPNGQYNTTIQDKIIIEEGDVIELKSAFIDTEATSQQKVIVDHPLRLEIDHVNYIINHFKSFQASESTGIDVATGTFQPDPVTADGKMYVACNKLAPVANLHALNEILFTGNRGVAGNAGGFNVFFNFTDPEGVKRSEKFFVPSFSNNAPPQATGENNILFLGNEDFNISVGEPTSAGTGGNGDILGGTGAAPSGTGSAPVFQNTSIAFYKVNTNFPTDDFWSKNLGTFPQYKPIKTTYTFDLDAGNYAPDDLCEAINRALNTVGASTATNLPSNNFLQVVEASSSTVFVCADTAGIDADYRYKYSQAPASPALYNGVYVGASDMTLSFEPNTQKFMWEYAHQPFIASNVEATGFQSFVQLDTDTVVRPVTRAGGIMFQGLRSTDLVTNQQTEFWSQQLGFQTNHGKPNCILQDFTMELNLTNGLVRTQCIKPVYNGTPTVGTQLTANFQSVASTVHTVDASFFQQPSLGQAGSSAGTFFSTSQKTTPIEGGTNILALNDRMTFGYFLIEVKSNFQNNFITTDENRANMMAIVSRYYEKDAYTVATAEDGLMYIHQGEPMLLSSFDVRILDADKNLATNIGKDSTVFLNIQKNPNPKKTT